MTSNCAHFYYHNIEVKIVKSIYVCVCMQLMHFIKLHSLLLGNATMVIGMVCMRCVCVCVCIYSSLFFSFHFDQSYYKYRSFLLHTPYSRSNFDGKRGQHTKHMKTALRCTPTVWMSQVTFACGSLFRIIFVVFSSFYPMSLSLPLPLSSPSSIVFHLACVQFVPV